MWWLPGALAAPSAEELAALWAARTAAGAALPTPALSPSDWERVARGEVAKLRIDEEGADRAVGVRWMEHGPAAIWVAIQDDTHDTLVSGLHELQLAGTTPEHKILYQRLDLPAPFSDRHWVLLIENNPAAFSAGLWERVWWMDPRMEGTLSDLPPEWRSASEGAVYPPINEGGWWLLPAEGGTLVVYQVRATVGGNIPEELVLRYALATLDEMMGHIQDRAGEIPAHYGADHFPLLGADNQPIPPW